MVQPKPLPYQRSHGLSPDVNVENLKRIKFWIKEQVKR